MRFIEINKNILVNPQEICVIKRLLKKDRMIVMVRVDGEDYELDLTKPGRFEEFLRELNSFEVGNYGDRFVG